MEDADDSDIYFQPEVGNVIFASAVDGWAFRVHDFATMYEKKLNIPAAELEKVLWGDFYYSTKEKTFKKGAQEKAKKPMFVQFILENIWNLYELIAIRKDREKIPGITEKLGIKLNARDLRQTDPKAQIQAVFSQWLPVEKTILEMVVRTCPHPGLISDEKAKRLMCSLNQDFDSLPEKTQKLKEEFKSSNADSETVIVFISKMVSVDRVVLPENKPKPLTKEELERRRELTRQRIQQRQQELESGMSGMQIADGSSSAEAKSEENNDKKAEEEKNEDDEEKDEGIFIAFSRVYSGTLRKGSKLFVLTPKHDPSLIDR